MMLRAARITRIACGAGILLLSVFWALFLFEIAAGFVAGGLEGARGNLHRFILQTVLRGQVERDPILALSRGYECLAAGMLLTWVLREIYALANARLKNPALNR